LVTPTPKLQKKSPRRRFSGRIKYMKNIYKNYFDIVILPPREVRDYAIKLSKQLYKHGSRWLLGKENFIPHISLFHIPVKPKNFDDFITNLEITVKGLKRGQLKVQRIRLWEPYPSLLLMADKPKWLNNLYLKVIKKMLKYFDWDYGVEKLWHIKKLPKIMKKNVKKYGTPLIGRYFMPHITLGVFRDDKNMIDAFNKLKLKPKKYNFEVKSIFVCELGVSHSCQRIVKEICF